MRQFPRLRLYRFVALGAAGFIYGCGGYVSTGGGPDFAITASVTSVSLDDWRSRADGLYYYDSDPADFLNLSR